MHSIEQATKEGGAKMKIQSVYGDFCKVRSPNFGRVLIPDVSSSLMML